MTVAIVILAFFAGFGLFFAGLIVGAMLKMAAQPDKAKPEARTTTTGQAVHYAGKN